MSSSPGTIVGIGVGLWFFYQWILFHITKSKVKSIPTIGSDGFISSYITAWKFLFNAEKMIQEGYDKYPGTVFKIPTLFSPNRWFIVLNGSKLVEDVRKASESELSVHEVILELMKFDDLWRNTTLRTHPYHIDVVRGPMTRGFPNRFDDIKDEITHSFSELLPATIDWTGVSLHKAIIPIVCRTSNRLFVGLPLCRNPEYCYIQENLTVHNFAASQFLDLLPVLLRPIVGPLITTIPSSNKKLQKHLGPLIRERLDMDEQHGGHKWEGRPNDLISWLLEMVPDECRNLEDLTMRVILTNFGAIHTTSITLSNTLFDLAAHQEYISPLREEVEGIIKEYGWTKQAMGRMRKLDSFIKESSRMTGNSALSVGRRVMKDFKLSNGVVIPAGFTITVASLPTHLDEALYDDANTFKGFRFAEMREGGEEFDHLRHQMVSLDPNYLLFGYGRPACPGRFFAVNEVKAMLSYILMNYDIKLPDGQKETPSPHWVGSSRSPNQTAKVMFRKRQT